MRITMQTVAKEYRDLMARNFCTRSAQCKLYRDVWRAAPS